jgi:K+-transporting ATPase A subunit
MKIKRLLLAVLLPLISAGILFAVLNGVPQGMTKIRELDTFWLLWPLVITVGVLVISVLYKVLGMFGLSKNDKN